MAYCSQCGKKLGFFSNKHETEKGLMCSQCEIEYSKQQIKLKDKEIEIKELEEEQRKRKEQKEAEEILRYSEMKKRMDEQKIRDVYKKFHDEQKAKGLILHKGYWWKPQELEFKQRFDEYWAEKEKNNDFKGDWMYCDDCYFEWKIKKERSLPARCGKCHSENIIVNKMLSHPNKNIGHPETKDMNFKEPEINMDYINCPACNKRIPMEDLIKYSIDNLLVACPDCNQEFYIGEENGENIEICIDEDYNGMGDGEEDAYKEYEHEETDEPK